MARTIYMTDKARESHIQRIEDLIKKLNSSEECMRVLGYNDLRETIRYLRDLQKATQYELVFH